MVYCTGSSRTCGSDSDGGGIAAFLVFVFAAMMGTMGMSMMIHMETPLECKFDKLRFALESEGSVDDELSDIVKISVHCQYIARIWVLQDRGGEDARCEFGREIREGGHGTFPTLRLESQYGRRQQRDLNLTPSISIVLFQTGGQVGKPIPQVQHPPTIEYDNDNGFARDFDGTDDITDAAATGDPRRMYHMQNNRRWCTRWGWFLCTADVTPQSPWVDPWEKNNGRSWCL